MVATDQRFTTIATSGHTCAVNLDHEAYCWGSNAASELGIAPSDSMSLVPEPVVGGHAFTEIHVGLSSTCGLTTEGQALCWGENWGSTPEPVPTSLRFASMSLRSRTACALTAEGEAYCWGSNRAGAFGNGERDPAFDTYHAVPEATATDLRFSMIATGGSHTCAIDRETEAVYCWGADASGQIGDGTALGGDEEEYKLFPTRAKLSRRFTDIGVGLNSSCGITSEREAHCWGRVTGNPFAPVSDVPVRVGG
jgi:alpha-tubulin suppressor-like RCC1 family protein